MTVNRGESHKHYKARICNSLPLGPWANLRRPCHEHLRARTTHLIVNYHLQSTPKFRSTTCLFTPHFFRNDSRAKVLHFWWTIIYISGPFATPTARHHASWRRPKHCGGCWPSSQDPADLTRSHFGHLLRSKAVCRLRGHCDRVVLYGNVLQQRNRLVNPHAPDRFRRTLWPDAKSSLVKMHHSGVFRPPAPCAPRLYNMLGEMLVLLLLRHHIAPKACSKQWTWRRAREAKRLPTCALWACTHASTTRHDAHAWVHMAFSAHNRHTHRATPRPRGAQSVSCADPPQGSFDLRRECGERGHVGLARHRRRLSPQEDHDPARARERFRAQASPRGRPPCRGAMAKPK